MSKWKELLAAIAPTAANMLGGPFAGMAVKALSQKLLNKDDGTEEEVAQAVANASPETLLKIKEVDKELKLGLAQVGVRLEEIHQADRASARMMAVAKGMSPQVILSAIFLGGFFWSLSYTVERLSGVKLDPDLKLMVASMLGMFSREIPTIMQFWFGTSAGSKAKTDIIDRVVNHKE